MKARVRGLKMISMDWGKIAVVLAGVALLIGMYQVVESSEAELRSEMKSELEDLEAEIKAEMQRIEAERKAETAEILDRLDRFIERVDSRLDEVEQEQARLDAVNELLAQQQASR